MTREHDYFVDVSPSGHIAVQCDNCQREGKVAKAKVKEGRDIIEAAYIGNNKYFCISHFSGALTSKQLGYVCKLCWLNALNDFRCVHVLVSACPYMNKEEKENR